ncbi:PQQ-dependent sugar dehydrogenase [Alkalitalea saponilacus]|uniref:Glucose/arabinose dehydrogenase, beta-propeller fold n=1 Tax=Alkalitalea saponilacus TaxID=889453 RepID=A0A1T5H4B4_9BACT|nr:PQQ-dependent sugar dehydrogenase [Alkalitalea saponilacus]ASB50893.1 sugar dehydrogenase [Alkalitalea saponilacus]SKC15498.1 Glucose/arabinose dehydrogenase, beta-propeller fold [Alkalitalea saponilacus]
MNFKHLFTFLLLSLSMAVFWLVTASTCSDSKKVSFDMDISDKSLAISNYERYCASCHGLNMERFAGEDREAMFNMPLEDMIAIIRDGDIESGMPAFGQSMSAREINDMAVYILTDMKEANQSHDYRPSIGEIHESEKVTFRLDTVATGLEVPWGLTWLPDGDMLVAERSGHLFRFRDGVFVSMIEDLPPIFVHGQGGLMDVRLHPDYENNGWLYLAYSTYGPQGPSQGGNTAIMRARLQDNRLVDKEELFKGLPDTRNGVHFGSRMVFGDDGYLYFSIGDRGNWDNSQDLTNHAGKIHRIAEDGTIPQGNPFVNEPGAMGTIWSYGHRNPQGLVKHPETGVLWSHEHGPKGGDELNIIEKGLNYGWPVISYGINYDGSIITEKTEKEGMEQPVIEWTPSIAPCGMTFVTGEPFKAWENSILSGSLSFRYLVRNEIVGNEVVHEEILLREIGRVRNVEMGPDGYVYVAVENPGVIFRLVPVGD